MKPGSFDYVRVGTSEEALDALGSEEDARILAGGQSLVPLMNLRLAAPSLLVDINAVAELSQVRVDDGELRLGTLCRHRRLEADVEIGASAPLLSRAAALIGHPQIRNRGTIGGSLAHADPASELGAALVALGGRVRTVSASGGRWVPAGELFEGVFTTSLRPDELLAEVAVPVAADREGVAFAEHAPRDGDFAVVGVAAVVRLAGDGTAASVRASACGIGPTVVDLAEAVGPVIGNRFPGDDGLREIAHAAAGAGDPISDVHASAQDRRELVQLLLVSALRTAWERAERSDR